MAVSTARNSLLFYDLYDLFDKAMFVLGIDKLYNIPFVENNLFILTCLKKTGDDYYDLRRRCDKTSKSKLWVSIAGHFVYTEIAPDKRKEHKIQKVSQLANGAHGVYYIPDTVVCVEGIVSDCDRLMKLCVGEIALVLESLKEMYKAPDNQDSRSIFRDIYPSTVRCGNRGAKAGKNVIQKNPELCGPITLLSHILQFIYPLPKERLDKNPQAQESVLKVVKKCKQTLSNMLCGNDAREVLNHVFDFFYVKTSGDKIDCRFKNKEAKNAWTKTHQYESNLYYDNIQTLITTILAMPAGVSHRVPPLPSFRNVTPDPYKTWRTSSNDHDDLHIGAFIYAMTKSEMYCLTENAETPKAQMKIACFVLGVTGLWNAPDLIKRVTKYTFNSIEEVMSTKIFNSTLGFRAVPHNEEWENDVHQPIREGKNPKGGATAYEHKDANLLKGQEGLYLPYSARGHNYENYSRQGDSEKNMYVKNNYINVVPVVADFYNRRDLEKLRLPRAISNAERKRKMENEGEKTFFLNNLLKPEITLGKRKGMMLSGGMPVEIASTEKIFYTVDLDWFRFSNKQVESAYFLNRRSEIEAIKTRKHKLSGIVQKTRKQRLTDAKAAREGKQPIFLQTEDVEMTEAVTEFQVLPGQLRKMEKFNRKAVKVRVVEIVRR